MFHRNTPDMNLAGRNTRGQQGTSPYALRRECEKCTRSRYRPGLLVCGSDSKAVGNEIDGRFDKTELSEVALFAVTPLDRPSQADAVGADVFRFRRSIF